MTHPTSPSRPASVAALAVLLAAGCGETRLGERLPPEATAARVDVFLRATGGGTEAVRIEIAAVRLRDSAGNAQPLDVRRPVVSSTDAARRIILAGAIVPPGEYTALVLSIQGASLERGGRRIPLPLRAPAGDAAQQEPADTGQPVDVQIPLRLEVSSQQARAVFLEWDVEASLALGPGFQPVFAASFEAPTTRLGLLYVADSATGSILSVSRAGGQVVGSAKVGSAPRALALSRDRRFLYVANSGDGSLAIVDTQSSFAYSRVPIRLTAGTSDVALADDGRMVAVCNPGIDTVALIDARDGTRLAELHTGRAPVRLVASDRLRRLYVVDSHSDELSVIDLSSRSLVASVPLEPWPSCVALDRREREVFVGHRTSPRLLVLDAQTLAITATIHVGPGVTALLADRLEDRLYVACDSPPEILTVDRRLSAVVRRTRVSGRVEALAQPVEGPLLYGAAPGLGGLVVLDVILGREEPLLPCGQSPTDVIAVE